MENSTLFQAYLLAFSICLFITIGLLLLFNKGLKIFFENLSDDKIIAEFFTKLTKVIILLGGISGGLGTTIVLISKIETNWLTLTWDLAEQIENSLVRLFYTLMILSVVFFILHLCVKKTKNEQLD